MSRTPTVAHGGRFREDCPACSALNFIIANVALLDADHQALLLKTESVLHPSGWRPTSSTPSRPTAERISGTNGPANLARHRTRREPPPTNHRRRSRSQSTSQPRRDNHHHRYRSAHRQSQRSCGEGGGHRPTYEIGRSPGGLIVRRSSGSQGSVIVTMKSNPYAGDRTRMTATEKRGRRRRDDGRGRWKRHKPNDHDRYFRPMEPRRAGPTDGHRQDSDRAHWKRRRRRQSVAECISPAPEAPVTTTARVVSDEETDDILFGDRMELEGLFSDQDEDRDTQKVNDGKASELAIDEPRQRETSPNQRVSEEEEENEEEEEEEDKDDRWPVSPSPREKTETTSTLKREEYEKTEKRDEGRTDGAYSVERTEKVGDEEEDEAKKNGDQEHKEQDEEPVADGQPASHREAGDVVAPTKTVTCGGGFMDAFYCAWLHH